MGRPGFILIFCLAFFTGFAQSSLQKEYSVRDSLVEDAMQAENYALAVGLIDEQFKLIRTEGLLDSLYHYCYNYGRAIWKTSTPEKGIRAAQLISDEVKEKDAHLLHYLQTLNDLSWLYYETGDLAGCRIVDSVYLAKCLENDDVPTEKINIAHFNQAYSYYEAGQYKLALEHFQASIDVILESGEDLTTSLSKSYNALGAMQWHLGMLDEASESYKASLALIENNTDPQIMLEKGNIIGNMALIVQDNGDFIKAREYQEQMIQIDNEVLPKIEDVYMREIAIRRISSAYVNLADIYFVLGDYSKSRNLLQLALQERKKILNANDPAIASVKEQLAFLEMESGNYALAEIEIKEYLAYCLEYFGQNSVRTAWAYKEMGILFLKLEKYEESEEYFNKAIKSQLSAGNPNGDWYLAIIYRERAMLFSETKRSKQAIADLKKSLEIFAQSRKNDNRVFVEIYLEMAEIKMKDADFSGADKDVNKALTLLSSEESLKQSAFLFPNAYYLKALLETKKGTDLALQKVAISYLEKAIEYLKEDKQSFLDEESKLILYDAHKKIFELAEDIAYALYDVTKDKKWIDDFYRFTEENRTILLRYQLQNFSALDYAGVPDSVLKKERKLTQQLLNDKNDLQEMQDIVGLERQYETLIQLIREKYPEYYALKYSDKAYTIKEVQNRLFVEDISLLIYSMTEEYVYALLIEKETAELFRMPKGNLAADIQNLNKALVQRNNKVFDSLAARLYENVFEPVQASIQQNELIIVPDEELFFLNFEILPDKVTSTPGTGKMLIHTFTISYFLSTTVAMQFRDLDEIKPGTLLTFAPGFSDRQKQDYQRSVSDSSRLDKKFLRYIQQPFAVQTAKNIAGIFSGASFIEEEADETTFKKESANYGIIHLGTHAETNQNSPLMSYLVLSKNMKNDSLDDGYLHAYEIYQMPLQAELAVLTACETGVGKQQNSEGVISLAHSFSYAGCPSIVMSLWSIDEKTSAGIISDFYHYLGEGMHKNKALRQAKLDYLANAPKELQLPYYWAGLVLLGDHNPVMIEKEFNWFGLTFVSIVLIIFLGFFFRKKLKS
jgi:CHAT domain-containing protein/TolA-binding protein